MALPDPPPAAAAALAPTGVLRAAINLSNFLLVTGRDDDGLRPGCRPTWPGSWRDVSASRSCSGATGHRETSLTMRSAACGTSATSVPSPLAPRPSRSRRVLRDRVHLPRAPRLADRRHRRGRPARTPCRIGARAAYDLWLERNLHHAELVRSPDLGGSFDLFVNDGLDALAGLRPALMKDTERLPGSRVLEGRFSSVQQAMGTPRGRDDAGFSYLREFVEEMKASGFVADRIAAHGVVGLSVARRRHRSSSPVVPRRRPIRVRRRRLRREIARSCGVGPVVGRRVSERRCRRGPSRPRPCGAHVRGRTDQLSRCVQGSAHRAGSPACPGWGSNPHGLSARGV